MAKIKEANVRDSLAVALDALAPGLTFIKKEAKLPSELGTTGFIDLLAQDDDQRYVLIEVKLTKPATRETLHEILKYIEGAKSHLGLLESELRVMIAAVDWTELIVPFSSFVKRTTCLVEGFSLTIDTDGQVLSATRVDPLDAQSDRLIAPWHEVRYYTDEVTLNEGIATYAVSCQAKGISDYVLVVLDSPVGMEDGRPSSKEAVNGRAIAEMAAATGQPIKSIDLPKYKHILYFAMQQIADEVYEEMLVSGDEEPELIQSLQQLNGEEKSCALHEALLDKLPRPKCAFFEIGYAAKFRGRLLQDEGWQIAKIHRYGAFARNALLTDETIIEEIGGSRGNAKQSLKMLFCPANKAEVAEVRHRVDQCLSENSAWRTHIHHCLTELVESGEQRTCYISVMNPSSAVTTIYLVASRQDGVLYIPEYKILVPEGGAPERMYYGALKYNGSRPYTLRKILDDFYNGKAGSLLGTLMWGGYESRDVQIVRKLGLRYKTYVLVSNGKRQFFELDDHVWEPCEPTNPIESYFDFLDQCSGLTKEVCDLYSSRWDGTILMLQPGD